MTTAWGAWFQNTSNSVINHASGSANDTGGYVLDGSGSYGDTIDNSGASGDGSICFTFRAVRMWTSPATELGAVSQIAQPDATTDGAAGAAGAVTGTMGRLAAARDATARPVRYCLK